MRVTRVEGSTTCTQGWDAENRLATVTVNGPLRATTFVYDGDGNRVKKMQGGQTTVYLGALYEKNVSTGVATSYYYTGSTRVAMRQGGSVSWLVGDHLGSTSVILDINGAKVGEMRYTPFGETRYSWGSTPTDRRYTGQREENALGSLYDYGARMYSPAIGRFISADTIVPLPENPQSLNRYSYVNNRPLNFTDPTGNFSEDEIMKAFHVKTWEEVLAIFGKGGLLEGRWGWLEILRQAEVGDYVDIQWDSTLLPEGHPAISNSFRGWFTKDREGQLLIGHKEVGYYLDQLKAGLYGKQYDLTHYIREGVYGALTCVDGLACDTSHFSTSAIHEPYLHRKVKWDKFLKEPLATMELIEMGAITTAVSVLTVGEMAAVAAACTTPISCAVGAAVMGPNVALTGVAARGLATGTYRYFMNEFTMLTP